MVISVQRYNLDDGRAREDAVMLRIGRMTVKAVAIDEAATRVLVRLLSPGNEALASAAFATEVFGTKMRFLKRVLPDAWPDKKLLLRAMTRFEDYRKGFAHSTVHTSYALVERLETTRLYSANGVGADLNPDDFSQWEALGEVTRGALVQRSYEDDADPGSHTARELLEWYFTDTPLQPSQRPWTHCSRHTAAHRARRTTTLTDRPKAPGATTQDPC
jgi:hypothetical protein